MRAHSRAGVVLWLLAVVNLIAVGADRLKQFSFVGMLGLHAPGSSLELLKLNLFMQVPMLLFSPLLGALLDRWNRATAIIVTCVLRAFVVATIPRAFVASGDSLYAMYGIAFALSFADLTFAPARAAILPDIVGKERLLQANATMWVTGIIGTFGGVLAGGWLFDFRSWEWAFFTDAAVYAVAAVLMVPVLVIYTRHMHASPPAHEGHASRPGPIVALRRLLHSIRDGIELIRSDHNIAVSLLVQCGLFAVGGVASIVGIARIQSVAPAGKASFLAIVAASLVAGLIAGAGLAALFRRSVSIRRTISVSAILTGVAIAGMGRTETLIPLSIWGAVLGMAISPTFIVTETLMQHESPREFLGRVFAAREALVKAAYIVAAVLATLLDSVASKAAILVSLGLFLALLGVFLERATWLKEKA